MHWLIDKLLSPNFWVLVVSLLGIGGQICVITGFLVGSQALMYVGMWLFAPLVLGGVLLLVVAIPLVIIANWKHRQK